MSLSIGESQTVRIEARNPQNHTGLRLDAGQRVRFTATGIWEDNGMPSGPDGNPNPPGYFRLAAWIRPLRHNRWFVLGGDVGGEKFAIGSGIERTIGRSGELICFANDVRFITRFFYGNNSGHVTLTVSRLA